MVEAAPTMENIAGEDDGVEEVRAKLSTHEAGTDGSLGVRGGDGAGPHLAAGIAVWAAH